MMSRVYQMSRWLARPVLLHWLMPYLMLLVVMGTVAQKYIGLYESQRLFFSSFVLWVGWCPLPGARVVSGLLLLSLLAKLLVASPWSRAKSGIFIAHLGVALLLIGGIVTSFSTREGYMVLGQHERADYFSDYNQRVLTIRKNDVTLIEIPVERLMQTAPIVDAQLPFTVAITYVCSNCTMANRAATDAALHGPAQKVMLSAIANDTDDERNLAGPELVVSGAGKGVDGIYIAFEPMSKQPRFSIGKDRYDITLRRARHTLPFTLQLLTAEKDLHPGTGMVRSYRSTVMLRDGAVQQRAEITMNHPLRYRGYTVYQSSFNSRRAEAEASSVSFAVVRNAGRVFPYIASVTLCIGLLIHLCFKLPNLMQRGRYAA